MKNIICISLIIVMAVACNSKTTKPEIDASPSVENTDTTATTPVDNTGIENQVADQKYACPMHPEVTGNKDEECLKCGMALTEPVKK